MDLPANLWKSPLILQRLAQEAEFECRYGKADKPHYWFAVPEADTKVDLIELKNYVETFTDIDPHPHQKGMARELMVMLNSNIDHDGLWIVGWTHPPPAWETIKVDGDNCWGRMLMIWLDEDGDIQFPFETDSPLFEIVEAGLDHYVEMCEKSWQAWNESFGREAQKKEFALKEEQLTKKTLESLH